MNDKRLAYDLRDLHEVYGLQDFGPGLYAVDRDGRNSIQLASRNRRQVAPQPWNTYMINQAGSQDSDWIYVEEAYWKDGAFAGVNLYRLNTLTGKERVTVQPRANVSDFMLDTKGEPRLALRFTDERSTIYYFDPADKSWRELAGTSNYGDEKHEIRPVGFGADGKLYVAANAGNDLATLRTLDVATGAVAAEPLVSAPGYDFSGKLLAGSGKLLGVRLTTDARSDVWFDPAMKTLQAAVDKALPRTVNLIDVPARRGAPWVLVTAYSDVQPPHYLLYDTRTGTLDPVGSSYPQIDPAHMGRQEPIRYKARDGLEIPGLLTLPPGGVRKNLPMVVLVHGGPWVRGSVWGWNPESQFLATRGYAVLEVEYRGSTGFGVRHFEAGLKQWGLAMQDDIADGTRWAIAQGIADPHRICIAGASYGGYAALMGLVKDPDLYQCGIDWSGVTDIELMYTGTWYAKSDASEGYLRYGMPYLIGDREKDAAQLKATSPIQQAARIHQPLLLAYGSEDERVPVYHGKRFRDAVERTNDHVEWIEYDGEGHGWSLPENRIDFWQRVERFLQKNIGAQPAVK